MISNTLTLKQIEALVWVADLGSFRKAAAHLNTTQPNISARIAALESTLGVVLMQRDSGPVRLTEKGRALVEQARSVLRAAEAMVEIAARPDLIADRLRLGVTEMVACTWLRRFLRRLRDTFPNVAVELTVDLSAVLDKALGGNALDLTIQNAPYSDTATGAVDLGSYGYVWVVAPDVVPGTAPGAGALGDLPVLTHGRHTQAYRELIAYFDRDALPLSRIVPSSSLTSSLHMAQDGMGVAVVLRAMVLDQLAEGTLVEVDPGWHPEPLRFAARYRIPGTAGFIERAAGLAAGVSAEWLSENSITPIRTNNLQ